jgi:hypothetical protein
MGAATKLFLLPNNFVNQLCYFDYKGDWQQSSTDYVLFGRGPTSGHNLLDKEQPGNKSGYFYYDTTNRHMDYINDDNQLICLSLGTRGEGVGAEIHNSDYNTGYNRSAANGNNSFVQGFGTIAKGAAAHSEGLGQDKKNYASPEENAVGVASHTEGTACYTYGPNSHAEGYATSAIGSDSHSEGNYTSSIGKYSHSSGYHTYTYGIASSSLGSSSYAFGNNSLCGG